MTDEEQVKSIPESGEQETPRDLAKVWLERHLVRINNEVEALENGYEFARDYEPTHPGHSPAEGPGSLDYSDWENEVIEYNQWPEEQIEILDSYPERIMDLQARADEVKAELDAVVTGDPELTNLYALLEQERRTIAKERSGMEYEGSKEIHDQLMEIFQLAGFDSEYRGYKSLGKKGSNGWRVADQTTIGGYSQHLYFNHKSGSGGGYSSQIRLSKGGSWEPEQRAVSVSFSDKVKKPNTPYGGGEAVGGMFFLIKDGVVSLQSVRDNESQERRFTQKDLDRFKDVLKVLYTDLKEINSLSSTN